MESDEKPRWSTLFQGQRVELPHTIGTIRDALPAERQAEFDAEVTTAPAEDLPLLLGHWALETRPDIRAADEATFERLRSGDFSGTTEAEDV